MRVKIIGFKVGEPYPTFNKTIDQIASFTNPLTTNDNRWNKVLGENLAKALDKSDFISIRWVK